MARLRWSGIGAYRMMRSCGILKTPRFLLLMKRPCGPRHAGARRTTRSTMHLFALRLAGVPARHAAGTPQTQPVQSGRRNTMTIFRCRSRAGVNAGPAQPTRFSDRFRRDASMASRRNFAFPERANPNFSRAASSRAPARGRHPPCNDVLRLLPATFRRSVRRAAACRGQGPARLAQAAIILRVSPLRAGCRRHRHRHAVQVARWTETAVARPVLPGMVARP